MFEKEITLAFSIGNPGRDRERLLAMIQAGALKPSAVITDRVPLDEAAEGVSGVRRARGDEGRLDDGQLSAAATGFAAHDKDVVPQLSDSPDACRALDCNLSQNDCLQGQPLYTTPGRPPAARLGPRAPRGRTLV